MEALTPASGLGAAEDRNLSQFLENVRVLLRLVEEDALRTSADFASSCGRSIVAPQDMRLALKYHAMTFLDQPNLESRFAEAKEAPDSDSDAESEDESEDGEDGGPVVDDEDCQEEYHTRFVRGDPLAHAAVLRADAEWSSWSPSDPAKALMKRAVDNSAPD